LGEALFDLERGRVALCNVIHNGKAQSRAVSILASAALEGLPQSMANLGVHPRAIVVDVQHGPLVVGVKA
jgi:hypothetical protein